MAFEKKSGWKKQGYYKKSKKTGYQKQEYQSAEPYSDEQTHEPKEHTKQQNKYYTHNNNLATYLKEQNELLREIVEQNKEIAKAILGTTQAIANFFEKLITLVEKDMADNEMKKLLTANLEVLQRIADALESRGAEEAEE